mgnify:FL=1
MTAVHRVLDANLNRAAEGMRVLEDIARFVLENQNLCSSIKKCRHELRSCTTKVTSRDTSGDVGTSVTTPLEESRNTLHDVAAASANRCSEALRVIEEFLKLANETNTVEGIRYTMYDLSAEVLNGLGAKAKKQWSLCFVMTVNDCVLPWQDTLKQSLVAGCDCVQIREKELNTPDCIAHTREVLSTAKTFGAQVIVNDRVDVMLATGADGVHLGEGDMLIQDARKLCGTDFIVGATVHNATMVPTAIAFGADYIGVGAMFASSTKPEVPVAPLGLLKNALAYNHLAIGGITPENVQELYAEGCKGIAVSSVIARSDTPEKVIAKLLRPEHQSA